MGIELSCAVDWFPGLLWTAFPDGRAEFVNQRWSEYTGLSGEEAAGVGWQATVHSDDRPALLRAWASIVKSGKPGEAEARLRRHDGSYRWFLFRVSPLTDGSGAIIKWCGINTDIEDRKVAEEALQSHEQRMRLILDGLPEVIVLMTPQADFLHANRHALDYAGLAPEDLKAWATGDLIHPDDRQMFIARSRVSMISGERFDAECRYRRADGVYRWFQSRGFPLRDDEGNIVLWYHLMTDIDDRKRAEALLAGENHLLEMVALGLPLSEVLDALCRLVEELADGCLSSILLIDPDDMTFQCGAAPSLGTGYFDAVQGNSVAYEGGPCGMAASLKTQVIVPDVAADQPWTPTWRDLSLAYGLRACWSTPILSLAHKALGTFTLHRREPASPTPFHKELIAQVTHIASIAIERARSDAALKSSEARKSALLDELHRSEALLAKAQRLTASGSFSWRPELAEITWSEGVYRIFEIDPAIPMTLELIGSRLHPADLHLMEDMIGRAQVGKELAYDHRLLMPDGRVKYLHMTAHPTRDPQGRLDYIGAVQDTTERRQSEEDLGKLRAELAHVARVNSLGAVTASIAHEINQPLAGIVTNANTCLRMLGAEPPNVEGALETARRTLRDGRRASDVMTHLRALFSKKTVISDKVDLNETTCEVVELLRSEIRKNRILLRLERADELPPVAGDRVQLQQVVLNLLLNAMEAMNGVEDRPRHLLLRIEREDGDRVRVAVTDTGTGFDKQLAGKLFEAFYTTKKAGMGIGLAVSRSIIESHGGHLSAISDNGMGATFSFSIPCRGCLDRVAANDPETIGRPADTDGDSAEAGP